MPVLDQVAAPVLVADLPVAGVRADEGEVGPRVAGGLERVAHHMRPVLVVAERHHEGVTQEGAGVAVGVDIGRVGDVIPVPLEEMHGRELPPRRPLVDEVVGPVEGDVASLQRARLRVEAHPAPCVVRLPGVDGGLRQDLRGPVSRCQHDHGHVARRAGRVAARQHDVDVVVAAHPVPPGADRVRDRPIELEQSAPRVRARVGLDDSLSRAVAGRQAGDQPPTGAAVPAEAVDLDAVARRRVCRHVEMDRLAGANTDLGRVCVDSVRRRRRSIPGRRSR